MSFSVNGPNDPHYDGVPLVPGSPYFLWPWTPPPPPGMGPYPAVRQPTVPWAVGIPTARPGDVSDYAMNQVASEAEIFQSEPDKSQGGTVSNTPNGTNNQILKDLALGLRPGFMERDEANVNAYSFGEDFFNGDETPEGGGAIYDWSWEERAGYIFDEPTVGGGGLPIRFDFSVDPWAIGLANTAVQDEATNQGLLTLPAGPVGSADVYSALGNVWQSDGEASSDVFSANPIITPGTNIQVYDDVKLALLAPRILVDLPGMEDDLDALEDIGTNTLVDGTTAESGNTHDRVAPTNPALNPPNGGSHGPGEDLGIPTNANHDAVNGNPIIFSVDRGTYGRMGSAVHAQVTNMNEGASGDLFIAVTVMDRWNFTSTTNMLLIDEGQLGLMPHDDLDAVIVKLLIDPGDLAYRIEQAALMNYNPDGLSSGVGFTIPLLNGDNVSEAVVGFSVDTSSIGQAGTAVDFECRIDGTGAAGVIPPASGIMEQAGDIFFSDLLPVPGIGGALDLGTGLQLGQNYLWFEEKAIGLDPGAWTFMAPGPSGNLGDLPDELNALDSLEGEDEYEVKWSQPPVPYEFAEDTYVGWDEEAHNWLPKMVADDFLCDSNKPITAIRWWGSFFNWYDNTVPPELPDSFYLTIWKDVPKGEPSNPEVKWTRFPDLTDNGIDVEATDPYLLADDYNCTVTGPVANITIWASWLNDYLPFGELYDPFQGDPMAVDFTLSIHADIPAGASYSMPGDPLWWQSFSAGTFTVIPEFQGLQEGWLTPPMNYIWPADTVCWRYDFQIDPHDAFVQQGTSDEPIVYWLDVQARPLDQEAKFGWKTSEQHWNDDAVWGDGVEPYMGPWFELRYPPSHELAGDSIDLAFEIVTTPESGPEYSHPNEIIWEHYCEEYDVNFFGWEFDPQTGAIEMPKFEFFQELIPHHWYQPDDNGIYWLGIMAIYEDMTHYPLYPWGWETREHYFMDDAVRLFQYPDPANIYVEEDFEPIEFPEGTSWDLSYELLSGPVCRCWGDIADGVGVPPGDGAIVDFGDLTYLIGQLAASPTPWTIKLTDRPDLACADIANGVGLPPGDGVVVDFGDLTYLIGVLSANGWSMPCLP